MDLDIDQEVLIEENNIPKVPWCCCTVHMGPKAAAMCEIVFVTIFVILGVISAIGGDFVDSGMIFALAAVTIIFCLLMIRNKIHHRPNFILPFIIWRPILLVLQMVKLSFDFFALSQGVLVDAFTVAWVGNFQLTIVGLALMICYTMAGFCTTYVAFKCYRYFMSQPSQEEMDFIKSLERRRSGGSQNEPAIDYGGENFGVNPASNDILGASGSSSVLGGSSSEI